MLSQSECLLRKIRWLPPSSQIRTCGGGFCGYEAKCNQNIFPWKHNSKSFKCTYINRVSPVPFLAEIQGAATCMFYTIFGSLTAWFKYATANSNLGKLHYAPPALPCHWKKDCNRRLHIHQVTEAKLLLYLGVHWQTTKNLWHTFFWPELRADSLNYVCPSVCLSVNQDEKNQMMTTNVWLKQVRNICLRVNLLFFFFFFSFLVYSVMVWHPVITWAPKTSPLFLILYIPGMEWLQTSLETIWLWQRDIY